MKVRTHLPIEEFGRRLLETGDLDPIYIALSKVEWDHDQIHRFLVAYWCFYDAGVACFMSEKTGSAFWDWMRVAALNEQEAPGGGRWPRGAERRHFRGAQGVRAVDELAARYPHDGGMMVAYIANGSVLPIDHSYKAVTARAMEHRGFGHWISYKIADMIERLDIAPVHFTVEDAMYDSPVKAAETLFRMNQGLDEKAVVKRDKVVPKVVGYLLEEFKGYIAPPRGMGNERPVGLQEIETILCKWGSSLSGHYPPGKDTREIREGLHRWLRVSPAAQEFLHWMPSLQADGAGTTTPRRSLPETTEA